jgi:hypothetical protein
MPSTFCCVEQVVKGQNSETTQQMAVLGTSLES